MVVRLRLSRFGCKNKPSYRVMAADSRSPRDGKHLEVLGYYNPLPGQDGGKRMGLNFDRVKATIEDMYEGATKLFESSYPGNCMKMQLDLRRLWTNVNYDGEETRKTVQLKFT
ncbi:small ribosomal subunit protein bS16m/bS16c isoform X2 [Nicotiana tabacum]|uniref:30S ribosomal protein S16 isoform X2 n=1 Tax=Nicotiana tabacum TaxID=4097 RepID=A0A1S4DMI0_TOBAC|nr:PREDICTED: 30S ribosomal protein S16-like isoform X2 [Nicotiana tabacum]